MASVIKTGKIVRHKVYQYIDCHICYADEELYKGCMLEKHWIDGLHNLNKISTNHQNVIDQFVKGISLSNFCCAMYTPDDELVFATDSFIQLFDVQPSPQTFTSLLKHCYEKQLLNDVNEQHVNDGGALLCKSRRAKPIQSFEVNMKNGAWLLVTEVTFDDGWLLVRVIDTTSLKQIELNLKKARDEAMLVAETDSLTQLLNRGGIMKRLDKLIEHAGDAQENLSVSLIDLDHFKSINDRFGHSVGDRVLQHFTKACRAVLRGGDQIGRVGGEEFLLVMPKADEMAATKVVNRLKNYVQEMIIKDYPGIEYTFSAGVISWSSSLGIDALYHQADQVLYHAKRNGRNQICNSTDVAPLSEVWHLPTP